jgi:hypothetical protein
MVRGIRRGRSRKLRSCKITMLYRIGSISINHGHCRHGSLGTRQAGSGFPGTQVLPAIPAERVAHHHSRTIGASLRSFGRLKVCVIANASTEVEGRQMADSLRVVFIPRPIICPFFRAMSRLQAGIRHTIRTLGVGTIRFIGF